MYRPMFVFGLSMFTVILQMGCQPESAYKAPPPPKVSVVTPTVETVPIFLEENGETEAVEQAVVEARVKGILQEVTFETDKLVTEGTPLFVIEQKEYLAAVKSAQASVSSAQAALEAAKAEIGVADAAIATADAAIKVSQAEYNRMKRLVESRAVSQSEFDAVKAQVEASTAGRQGAVASKATAEAGITNAQAKVEKAEADLVQAELKLEWTVVKAPIDGRATKILVKRGNMVENGTPLVEIVQNDPMWANFNINERFLLNLERQTGRNDDNSADASNIKVRLQRSGDTGFPFEGHLDFFDPKVDQDTGTMQLRAVFENKPGGEKLLLPGLFVRVRVQIGNYEDATLIPERAISRDQAGAFVYVVDADTKAMRKPVTLGTKYNGKIVVESGIDPNDKVIVDGIQRVRPGIEVDPS